MACLLLSAPNARAGSWNTVVTGTNNSTATVDGSSTGVHTWAPPTPSGTSVTMPQYSVGGTGPWGKTAYKASLSLKIVLTWQPATGQTLTTDPPPAILLAESGSATWTAGGAGTGFTLSNTAANDGITGDSYVLGTGTGKMATSGTHYTLVSADASGKVTVNRTFTASATVTNAVGFHGGNNLVSIDFYNFSISTVTLSLQGTTSDASGNPNILVGQGCTASLSNPPTGCTFSNYSWSASGTTFTTWQPTTPAIGTSPANPNASYYVGGIVPSNQSTAHWYWNDAGPNPTTETISCTATLTPPTGQGVPFVVTVTQKVVVQIPAFQVSGTGGYMQMSKNDPRNPNNNIYRLWARPTATMIAGDLPGGMNFRGTVTTPSVPTFGTGSIEIVQIVKPNDSYQTVSVPSISHTDPLNSITGLDLQYPYGGDVCTEALQPYKDNDNPGLALTGPTGVAIAASAKFASAFTDYLMYQPPGSAQWVPLGILSWSVNGNATIPATGNWADYVTQNGSDKAGTVTPNVQTQFTAGNSFPSWTTIDVSQPY